MRVVGLHYSLTLAAIRAKRTICKQRAIAAGLRAPADRAALEVRAVEMPAAAAGCTQLADLEERRLDAPRVGPRRAPGGSRSRARCGRA